MKAPFSAHAKRVLSDPEASARLFRVTKKFPTTCETKLVAVNELTGDALDHHVALTLDWKQVRWGDKLVWVQASGEGRFRCNVADWHPSTNPAQGWPIIDREQITVSFAPMLGKWRAGMFHSATHIDLKHIGDTSLIAAMRCFIASKCWPEFLG